METKNAKPNTTIVIGGKWGDEGKGKITSRLSKEADLVIRATGGANAGHTVVFNGEKIPLHLTPGGIVYPQTTCLIGQGVVLDVGTLQDEINLLKSHNIPNVQKRLKISGRAHVVMPYHKDLDALYESFRGNAAIGTTRRGIGPCYMDQATRSGIRVYDLLEPVDVLEEMIYLAVKPHNQLFEKNGMADCIVNPKALAKEYHELGKWLNEMITRDPDGLTEYMFEHGKSTVLEGAQAFRLDKFYGDYPDVTSSNCVTAGAILGGHLSHKMVKEVVVVVKAYDSRVGNGPFPTELPAHIDGNFNVIPYDNPYYGDVIREEAGEYGVTSGRARRCGWFDGVIAKSYKSVLGADYLCVNHMDTIGKIGEKLLGGVKICTAYSYQGRKIYYYPDDIRLTGEIPTPIYENFSGGWTIPRTTRKYEDLPYAAKRYIEEIEKISGVPVKYIGVGPDNEDLIVREDV